MNKPALEIHPGEAFDLEDPNPTTRQSLILELEAEGLFRLASNPFTSPDLPGAFHPVASDGTAFLAGAFPLADAQLVEVGAVSRDVHWQTMTPQAILGMNPTAGEVLNADLGSFQVTVGGFEPFTADGHHPHNRCFVVFKYQKSNNQFAFRKKGIHFFAAAPVN